MFGKMLRGELRLKKAFWYFAFWMLLGIDIFVAIVHKLLYAHIRHVPIFKYYTGGYFNPLHPDVWAIVLSLTYGVAWIFLILYIIFMLQGVWKCANEYPKSGLLRFLAKLFAVVFSAYSLYWLKGLGI